MNNTWKLETFSAEKINENIEKKIFTIPRYQRGVVWSQSQKDTLIDTIKKGLPFGSLLLYLNGNEKNNTYQIIDGLQRSTTIIDFVKNPALYFNEDDILDSGIDRIYKLANITTDEQAFKEQIKKDLFDWVRSGHKILKQIEGMQFAKFGQKLSPLYPTLKGKEFEIGEIIEPMMKNFQEICTSISSTQVPAIVIEGDSDALPLLFERINSQGSKLSKYQIYAATWIEESYNISAKLKDLVEYNRSRYDDMIDKGIVLDDYESTTFINRMSLNAFEIAYGLGKFLSKKWPHLFGDSKGVNEINSIGFTLLATCLGLKYSEIKTLGRQLRDRLAGYDVNIFLLKLIESINYVDKLIGKFSAFKLNNRSVPTPLHSELQIVSIISSVFLMKHATIIRNLDKDKVESISYDFENNKKDWKNNLDKLLKKNIAKIYIVDILQKRWSGTGDKKLDQILITPDYYAKRQITKDDFINNLWVWFDALNEERSEYKKVARPKEAERLILAAIYLPILTANEHLNDEYYDIEHLVPQSIIKQKLERFDGDLRLPISSIGNLCILPEYSNRSKKDKTIYNDTSYRRKSNIKLEEIEAKYSFTTKSDLEWIGKKQKSSDDLRQLYMDFIKVRFGRLVDVLLKNFSSL
ncbi:DUF262 domain-containing protein [Veillonella parvula]|uniref:DUF262 domain-containing protein n=1 Tax=Veillonella parvula TaxID=29466 RepID=UPI0019613DD4|nr:DUF262 domain-containing protein [Veillonella parvula]VTY46248.1 Uncharacterised protein [Veillonella parvula]